jgi:hypothetical protein
MIHKSQQQDTDRAGDRLLRATLEPLGWVLTGIEEDYGIDHDVQVFVDGSPEGLCLGSKFSSRVPFPVAIRRTEALFPLN